MWIPCRSGTNTDQGFSVLEALMALLIVSTVWIVLVEIPTTAVQSTSAVTQRNRAVQIARNELARSRVSSTLVERRSETKTADGFDLVVEVSRYGRARRMQGSVDSRLYNIVVAVSWDEPRSRRRGTFRLSTFQFAGGQSGAP